VRQLQGGKTRSAWDTPQTHRKYGRTKRNVLGAKSFWLDLGRWPRQGLIRTGKRLLVPLGSSAEQLGLPRPLIVLSGFGIHVYWSLVQTLDPETWERYARGLKHCAASTGCERTQRELRHYERLTNPGTHHRKDGNPPSAVQPFSRAFTLWSSSQFCSRRSVKLGRKLRMPNRRLRAS